MCSQPRHHGLEWRGGRGGVSDYYQRTPNPEWKPPPDFSLGQFGKGSWRPGQELGVTEDRRAWKPPGGTAPGTDMPMVPTGEIDVVPTGPLGAGTLPGGIQSTGLENSAIYKPSDGGSTDHSNHYNTTIHTMLADGRRGTGA